MPDVEVGDYNIKARLRNECQCFWNGSHGGNGALPRRAELAAKARTKFGDEPAIDARNAAGFGCGFVARVAFTSLCLCRREIRGLWNRRVRFEVFLKTII